MKGSKVILPLLLVILSLKVALAQEGPVPPERALSVPKEDLWAKPVVRVCWETTGFEIEKGWVQSIINREFSMRTPWKFMGWGQCTTNPTEIRIGIRDENPYVEELGKALNNIRYGMILNFTFATWSTSCSSVDRRQYCIEVIAVHEFGHAIGLAHEQNRSDTFGPNINNTCIDVAQGSSGPTFVAIGPWDPTSVMNYCNPNWNNSGRLSVIDIEAINIMYGGIITFKDWGYPWAPRAMVDVDGNGERDYCRFVGDKPNIFLSCNLVADNRFSGNEYDFNSIKGIDLGYLDDLPAYLADVNGDNRADYCRFVGDRPKLFLSCNLAEPTGFSSKQFGFNSIQGLDPGHGHLPRYLTDVNGDNRADYCRFVGDKIFLSCNLAEPSGFSSKQYGFNSVQGLDTGFAHLPRTLIDRNRDRRPDYCRYVGDKPNIFLSCNLATTAGFDPNQYVFKEPPDSRAWYNK